MERQGSCVLAFYVSLVKRKLFLLFVRYSGFLCMSVFFALLRRIVNAFFLLLYTPIAYKLLAQRNKSKSMSFFRKNMMKKWG